MPNRMSKAFFFLLFLIPLPGVSAAVDFPVDHLTIVGADGRGHDFTVEVATTREQLMQGLMFRRTLAHDAGMIFDFGQTKPVSMWMKNTLIPLDMIFVGADGIVTGVAERAIPQSTEIISSPGPVRAVIEVDGGQAQADGIKAGDKVLFPVFGTR